MAHQIVWATAATVNGARPAGHAHPASIIPGWDTPAAPAFGVLELESVAIRVMEGSRMAGGDGLLLEWRAG